MSKFILISMFFYGALVSAANKDVVVGKDWVVSLINDGITREIHQFFPDESTLVVEAKCTFPNGEAVIAKVKTSAEITESQIINRQVATQKIFTPSRSYWCMAVVARRTLDYRVLSPSQISIRGDGFIPDGSVLVGAVPSDPEKLIN